MNIMAVMATLGDAGLAFVWALISSPIIVELVATAVLLPLAVRGLQFFGIRIEAAHREALQSALGNGVRSALLRLDLSAFATEAQAKEAVQEAAKVYVKSTVPDAVKKFDLDDAKIGELLLPHIADALPFPFNVIADVAEGVVKSVGKTKR